MNTSKTKRNEIKRNEERERLREIETYTQKKINK
jgi:hypothetical protein